ncbi:Metallo-dependent phosphatase-like protein [Halteromyces radiatus]|uniref:Metallo-dependent phosphatase-like protein n=1 Tax=Halteromyces radiatus TaxID=101107 RepID=UPI00221FA576|nr:Metallo-dependent phosphatase-like protein [Halteromyces radiatus]KAI8088978.1 Metallo-dependent phosphatase-like protein [Halteromyces radiatus]
MVQPAVDTQDNANTLKILIATDNHIGYLEDDPVRGQDTFTTFEEILKLAQEYEVDFILLGGDLFHHNRPSRSCLYQTMRLLRQYCMGDRPSQIWIASDQSEHFHDDFPTANYLDPNLNVSYPVFSIHGNHDDPNGPGNLCALQLLSVTGMMNYFGRAHNIQDVTIQPILMKKGTTKLALYGLGNVRDERLHRMWRDGHVQFSRPVEDEWLDNSFNLFVLHQNRVKHGPTSYIPEQFLDGFLDLVLWGHEHDCRIDPEHSGHDGPLITQPGSSVATSLSEGESLAKHVGLLQINGQDYTLDKIRLTTVRPFQFTTVALNQTDVPVNDTKACQKYLQTVVDNLIIRAKEEWMEQQRERQRSNDSQFSQDNTTMPLPLIRVRVDYTGGYEIFNPQQFGQQYANRVANPKDMLKFQRTRTTTTSTSTRNKRSASAILDDVSASIPERLDQIKVEDLVNEFLSRDLAMLPENELEDAVKMFVDKDDKDAIRRFVNSSVTQMQQSIPSSTDVDVLTDEYIQRRATASKNARMQSFARSYAGIVPREQQSNGNNRNDQAGDTNIGSTIDSNNDMTGSPSRQRLELDSTSSRMMDNNDDVMMITEERTPEVHKPTATSRRRTTTKRKQQAAPVPNNDDADFNPNHDDDDDDLENIVSTSRTTRRINRPTKQIKTRHTEQHDKEESTLHGGQEDKDGTRTKGKSTSRYATRVTSDEIHQDNGTRNQNKETDDNDDEPLFETYHLPTQSQSRRILPSSLSSRSGRK